MRPRLTLQVNGVKVGHEEEVTHQGRKGHHAQRLPDELLVEREVDDHRNLECDEHVRDEAKKRSEEVHFFGGADLRQVLLDANCARPFTEPRYFLQLFHRKFVRLVTVTYSSLEYSSITYSRLSHSSLDHSSLDGVSARLGGDDDLRNVHLSFLEDIGVRVVEGRGAPSRRVDLSGHVPRRLVGLA